MTDWPMGFLQRFQALQNSNEVLSFVERDLLLLIYVGLAFGFSALLVEIRLPLKYYWQLPTYLVQYLLRSFSILKPVPIWGQCIDGRTNQPLPITAVELLDRDSLEVIKTTFSDRLGRYGFNVHPGKFIVRAVKNYYIRPPFYDPENIQLQSTDESLALEVEVTEEKLPELNLALQPVSVFDPKHPKFQILFYFRAFSINLANGFLLISIASSWYAWVITRSPVFAILLAVGIIFMFIKVYILEAVGSATN
jgi:hypothetical protein